MPPSGPRPTARPGAGPGRGKPRARTQPRDRVLPPIDPANEPTVALDTTSPAAGAKPSDRETAGTTAGSANGSEAKAARAPKGAKAATVPKGRTRSGSHAVKVVAAQGGSVLHRAVRANLTARALALVVVVLVLTISYASSLRIYFAQAHEIASTKAEIVERQAAIADLQGQIARWNDPAYVAAQARERLGWLVPGETGYTVVGPDGKPLGGGLTLDSSAAADPEQEQPMWWDRMWGSVAAADKPAPPKPNPGKRAPVTAQSKPR